MYQFEHQVLLLHHDHFHHWLIRQPHLRDDVLAENVIGKILISSLIIHSKKTLNPIRYLTLFVLLLLLFSIIRYRSVEDEVSNSSFTFTLIKINDLLNSRSNN